MNANHVSLFYKHADDIRSLERTPSGNYRLQGRGFHFNAHGSCIQLAILKRRDNHPASEPFFGVVLLQLAGLSLSIQCDACAIHSAHQAFPELAFKSEETGATTTGVPHEL